MTGMYLTHFNLKRKPFELTTDPKFLWLGEKHREALATLEYGIREEKGFILLTGDVGTGKTVLINGLVKFIDIKSFIATIPDPGLDPLDFFNALADSFGMERSFSTKGQFLAYLKKFLIQARADRQRVLLLVDEAQRLNHELLEEIRLLSNIELGNRKLINIFFVGQPELNEMLMEPRNKAVRQRIAVRYHIQALTEAEMFDYIVHRLKVAGTAQKLFSDAAVREIYAFSGGNPRLTNIICDHALLSGYSADAKVIDDATVRECAEDLRLPAEPVRAVGAAAATASTAPVQPGAGPSSFSSTIVAVIVFAMLIAAGGYLALNWKPQSTLPWSPDELTPATPKALLESRAGIPPSPPPTTGTTGGQGPLSGRDMPDTSAAQPPATIPNPPDAPDPTAEAALDAALVDKMVIRFKHNSNEVSDGSYQALDRFAAALIRRPELQISIKGYSDSTGALSYNLSVSEFRANLIKSYLVGKGVGPERIIVQGMGPENPVAPNTSEEGRSQNRRVEIEFVRKPAE